MTRLLEPPVSPPSEGPYAEYGVPILFSPLISYLSHFHVSAVLLYFSSSPLSYPSYSFPLVYSISFSFLSRFYFFISSFLRSAVFHTCSRLQIYEMMGPQVLHPLLYLSLFYCAYQRLAKIVVTTI